MLYNKTMGRPRKYDSRMTRTLTLRVPDDQYDWVVERAIDFDGDLSATTRDCIAAAQLFYKIIGALEPHTELQSFLDVSERERERDAYFDEFGSYPPG